jgi:hypothetical protein
MFTFPIWQTCTSYIDHTVTPTHHLQDCEYIFSAIVHSVCDLGLTIYIGPESAWRRESGSDGWIRFALDDVVLSILGSHSWDLCSYAFITQLTMAVKTPIIKKRTKPFKCVQMHLELY